MEKTGTTLRIKQLMDYYSLSNSEFANKTNINLSNFAKILSGERPCGDGIINKILLAFNVNREWLTTGNGQMTKTGPVASDGGVPYFADIESTGSISTSHPRAFEI